LPELFALKRGPNPRSAHLPTLLHATTGFYTFGYFKEVVFIEVKRARRYGLPLSMALIGFDPLRTQHPPLRDRLMTGLAVAIRRTLRDTDYPVQYTPDRVLLLMPHTDLAGAVVVSRRICDRISQATLTVEGQALHPTVSIGVAASSAGKDLSFGDLARNAQTSLDLALLKGGNRVEFHDSAGGTEVVAAEG
jgi:diguanylate cyclase (GGDEF)-like protein